MASLCDPGPQGSADFHGKLLTPASLLLPGTRRLFRSWAAAVLCSKAACALSLWRCSRALKHGSWLCLLRAGRFGGLPREPETPFGFFAFGNTHF